MIDELQKQLIRDEGVVLHGYADSRGYLTIGVGRLIDKRLGGGLSRGEAMFLLNNDIIRHTEELLLVAPWVTSLAPARQGVLINMAFNLGISGLMKFKKTLAAIQQGDFHTAEKEMLSSKWAGQVGDRATRLARQLVTGEWQ